MLILILIMYIDYRYNRGDCPSWGARLERATGHGWCPVVGNGLPHAITSMRWAVAGNWISLMIVGLPRL